MDMGIETGTALLISALVGGGTAAASSIIGSNAAKKAADSQSQAAIDAAKLAAGTADTSSENILKAAQESNSLQELMMLLGREDTAPWRETGGEALMTLKDLLQPEGYLAQEYPEFTGQFGFNKADVTMDPGFDFRMKEGQKAIERSAAARGGVLSGASGKALERYAQDYSSGEYSNAYNRTYGEAADRYNQSLERYRTNFNVDQTNRGNLFSRLSTLAGYGGQAAGQAADLGQGYATAAGGTSMNAANNVAGIAQNAANAAGNYNTSAAAARASGYVGSANAWNQGLSSLNQIPQYLMLQQLLNKKTATP